MLSARFQAALYKMLLNALFDVLQRVVEDPATRKAVTTAFDPSDDDGGAPQKVAALRTSMLEEADPAGGGETSATEGDEEAIVAEARSADAGDETRSADAGGSGSSETA